MRRDGPSPDELLAAIQEPKASRGRLKVFLGASAGVGKSYAMLSEAQEQRARGTDVVIGYIETHGRAETEALVQGLEVIPMAEVPYRDTKIRELDIEAIIARQPQLVLVDELAHTNAPGSRHTKRWQDIDDLLGAGIDVYTAVNIQHLESLNDVVAQVTGVRIRETVPDSFFAQADSVELIDIPPEELRQRLKEGKVYVPERIDHALEGFFKVSNLTALREMALRRTADTVDAEMRRLRVQQGAQGLWATRDRVVVCVAPSKMAHRIVRAAARMGTASRAEMIAVYVESDRQTARAPAEHVSAREALDLAAQLGMEVVSLQGHDIVREIIDFAHRRNATLVVVGKPIRPKWKEVVYGSVVDELIRASGDIDIHVITTEADPHVSSEKRRPEGQAARVTALGVALVAGATATATGLGFLIFDAFGIANVAMLYLLAVATSAMRCSRTESIIAAVLAVLAFNFFFVHPRFTFAVSDARHFLVFLVMLVVGLTISTLTHRLRGQLTASAARERRTASLYSLSRQLARARSKVELAKAAAQEIRGVFDGDIAIYVGNELLVESETGFEKSPNESAVAHWVAEHGEPAGLGTDTLPGASALYLPLRGSESPVGLMAFKPNEDVREFSQWQFLETFANALGVALERAVLAKASNVARIQAESERIRSTLLSSISHDLRTPLTSITGAASSLLTGQGDSRKLAEAIHNESIRLNHQIQNLLDMTRLQAGSIDLDLKWHAIEEIVASALRQALPSLGTRKVTVDSAPNLPLMRIDGLLLEKALINLLENSGRHTEASSAIRITSRVSGQKLVIEVADNGPGVAEADLNRLFGPGFRTKAGGYGLGLAVVKAVMDLHGGSVGARNEGGAVFTLSLPVPDRQPEAPHD